MIHVVSETPVLVIGGCPGIIHAVTFVSQVPTMPSSILCPSLGVMYFIQASIMACIWGSIFGCGFASWATTLVHTTSRARANQTLIFIPFLRVVCAAEFYRAEATSRRLPLWELGVLLRTVDPTAG